jgi:predicted phage tail protein
MALSALVCSRAQTSSSAASESDCWFLSTERLALQSVQFGVGRFTERLLADSVNRLRLSFLAQN